MYTIKTSDIGSGNSQSYLLPLMFSILTLFGFLLSTYTQSIVWVACPLAISFCLIAIHNLKALYFITLFTIPISIEYVLPNGLGTDLPSEPLMWLFTVCFILYLLRNRNIVEAEFIKQPIFFVLLLSFFWSIVCIFYSVDPIRSTKWVIAKVWYYIPFFVATHVFIRTPKDFRLLIWTITLPLFLIIVRALFLHFGKGFSFDSVNSTMIPFFRNHVNYAVMLAQCVPLIFWMSKQYKNQSIRRFALIFIGFIFIIGVYFSYTRAALLSMVVALVFIYVIHKKWLTISLVLGIAIFTLFIGYMTSENRYLRFAPEFRKTIYHDELGDHIAATFNLTDVSSAERIYRWIAGIRMIDDYPICGVGPNNFPLVYKQHTVTLFTTWVSSNDDNSTVHNYPLLMVTEQGIPALIILLLFFIMILYKVQNLYHKTHQTQQKLLISIIGFGMVVMMVNLMLADLMEVDKNGSLFLINLALLLSSNLLQIKQTLGK